MGVPSAKAHDLEELTKQLTYAMSQKGPYLIDVASNRRKTEPATHPLRPSSRQEVAGGPGVAARHAAAATCSRSADGARQIDPPGCSAADAREGVWLEVGFGAGEHLVWQAEQHPKVGLIGCETYINGVAECLAHIERAGVTQRAAVDGRRAVGTGGPARRSLSRVFVLFPDPWPKTRHHKRRFVELSEDSRCAGAVDEQAAELRLATDDPSYLPWMIEHACRHPAFEWLAERPSDWRPDRPIGRRRATSRRCSPAQARRSCVSGADDVL